MKLHFIYNACSGDANLMTKILLYVYINLIKSDTSKSVILGQIEHYLHLKPVSWEFYESFMGIKSINKERDEKRFIGIELVYTVFQYLGVLETEQPESLENRTMKLPLRLPLMTWHLRFKIYLTKMQLQQSNTHWAYVHYYWPTHVPPLISTTLEIGTTSNL